jgi:hypothetical protein
MNKVAKMTLRAIGYVTGIVNNMLAVTVSGRVVNIGSMRAGLICKAYKDPAAAKISLLTVAAMVQKAISSKDLERQEFKDAMNPIAYEISCAAAMVSKAEYNIFFMKEVCKDLSKKEKEAVRLHEVGHIVNGDLDGNGLLGTLESEYRADAYAAERVGKGAMRAALIKIREAGRREMAKEGPEWVEKYDHALESTGFDKRIAALER